MPAEWEPHAATWLAWPHNPEDWPGKFQPIPWVYAEIVRHLSVRRRRPHARQQRGRRAPRAHHAQARRSQHGPSPLPSAGPPTASGSATPAPSLRKTQTTASRSPTGASTPGPSTTTGAATTSSPSTSPPSTTCPSASPRITLADGTEHRLVLEGGSIDVNGAGTLITTEECLLSDVQQRNPGVTRAQLEQAFAEHLGIAQVLWLNRGCAGDDTHGHVDDITRFVALNRIVTCVERNTADENHLPLAENLARLHAARNLGPSGKAEPFEIITLPMPSPVVFEGQRLPASYANFYIANSLVLVPTFNDPNDRHALNILADCFPNRCVIGIHAVDLVWGLGTLHCMTQQEPA